ncbi:MAG: flagellar hook-associated protein FlgL [Firmicutes bacterium]|nr:flagellar hook-associated protein FlgL [Bacillota bacterium]
MRLTDSMMRSNLLRNLTTNRDMYYNLQQEISSGDKVINVSEDPGLYKKISILEDTQSRASTYLDNISTARRDLNTYEDQLNNLSDSLSKLKNLALQANNSTYYSSSKETFKQEAEDTLNYLVQIANNKQGGKYMFAGSEVDQAPFTTTTTDGVITSVAYNGDNKGKVYDMDTNDKISINVSGEEIFSGPAGMDQDIFQAVIEMRQDMTDSNFDNADTHIAKLQTIMDRVTSKIGEIGNKSEHIDDMENFMDNFKMTVDSQHADLRYTDMTEAISTLMNVENTLSAGMAVAARLNNLSIMDYMK